MITFVYRSILAIFVFPNMHIKKPIIMKCSFKDCQGEYEDKRIIHAVRHKGQVVVIENVPVEVCNVCGDILLNPEAINRIQNILQNPKSTKTSAPLYKFA